MTGYTHLFSDDAMAFVPSPVRAIFGKYDMSSVISFAGGYPASETFPTAEIIKASAKVFSDPSVFQYGPTEGILPLRKALAARFGFDLRNVAVTTSSQQGIDMCTRVLVNPGDAILVSEPSFLGAIQSFRSYRAEVRGVPYSSDAEALAQSYRDAVRKAKEDGHQVKFIYLIPDFNNPTGETLSLEARIKLLEVASEESLVILEDSPYRELRYEGEDVPSMYSLAPDRVIHLGSFSKILAPGFRLGWIAAPEDLLSKILACKQSVDLCAPMTDQHIALALLESGVIDSNLVHTRELYRRRRDKMISLLEQNMPRGTTWSIPQGGIFLYLTLTEGTDTVELYDKALKAGVAYVSGAFFRTDGAGRNTMRLNYSFASDEQLERGISILAQVLRPAL